MELSRRNRLQIAALTGMLGVLFLSSGCVRREAAVRAKAALQAKSAATEIEEQLEMNQISGEEGSKRLTNLGERILNSGAFPESQMLFEKALALSPESLKARTYRAISLHINSAQNLLGYRNQMKNRSESERMLDDAITEHLTQIADEDTTDFAISPTPVAKATHEGFRRIMLTTVLQALQSATRELDIVAQNLGANKSTELKVSGYIAKSIFGVKQAVAQTSITKNEIDAYRNELDTLQKAIRVNYAFSLTGYESFQNEIAALKRDLQTTNGQGLTDAQITSVLIRYPRLGNKDLANLESEPSSEKKNLAPDFAEATVKINKSCTNRDSIRNLQFSACLLSVYAMNSFIDSSDPSRYVAVPLNASSTLTLSLDFLLSEEVFYLADALPTHFDEKGTAVSYGPSAHSELFVGDDGAAKIKNGIQKIFNSLR